MRTLSSATVRRLTLLGRIKMMRLRITAQLLAKQTAFVALALMLGVGGIGMLMLCLYTVMAEAFGLVVGALTTGALLLAMAGGAVALAARQKLSGDTHLLDNLEENVMADIYADLAEFESGIRKLEKGTSALFKGDYLTAIANFAGGFK